MIRRDKVIRGLECMKSIKRPTEQDCAFCGYKESFDCGRNVSNDALAILKEDCHNCKLECLLQKYDELKEKYDALLKEQKAVEPIHYHRSDGTIFKYECRKCRTKIFKNDLFCRH